MTTSKTIFVPVSYLRDQIRYLNDNDTIEIDLHEDVDTWRELKSLVGKLFKDLVNIF